MFEVFAFSIIGSLIITSAFVIYMKLLQLEMLINKQEHHKQENTNNGEDNEA
ncbi:hypothetical protein [Persephonella sp.]|uniref:hypothetical protein n=1 Tax=Persephonella sp. TaxID=2060922 RepID=UPI0026369630|nr:hypothetical protein [Persephonella sp.]